MQDCQGCQRLIGRGWLVCGWCGVSQVARVPHKSLFSRMADVILLLQAMGVVGASIALVVWSRAGWTAERAQFLCVIWFAALLVLAFLAWVSVNRARWQERAPLFALRERQVS